jgi:hypothetical protein
MATWRKNFPQLSRRGLCLANPCTELSPEFFRLTVLYPSPHNCLDTEGIYWMNELFYSGAIENFSTLTI